MEEKRIKKGSVFKIKAIPKIERNKESKDFKRKILRYGYL